MSSTCQLLLGIGDYLSARRKRQLVLLCFTTCFSAVAELVSLGSIIPFLSVLTAPERLWTKSWVRHLASFMGWTEPSQLLGPFALLFVVAVSISAVVRLLNLRIGVRLAAAIGSDLSTEAYCRTLYQPYCVHMARNTSSVISKITSQSSRSVEAFFDLLIACASASVAIAILAGLILLSWTTSLSAVFIFGGLYVLLLHVTKSRLAKNSSAAADAGVRVLKSLQEGLGAIREVLLDGTQPFYVELYMASERMQRKHTADNRFLIGFPRFLIEATGLILVAVFAFLAAVRGEILELLPVLGAFALGAQRLLPAMQQVYGGWSSVRGASADLESILTMLSQPMPPKIGIASKLRLQKEIYFKNVLFSYAQGSGGVIQSLSLKINAGCKLGIIGSTGSGKSTTVDLLMGLLSPTQGQILVDGLDLHDPGHPERLLAWRSAIAHVPQSIYLADSSIAENIAFGFPKEKIDFDRVRLAAQQAQIASFIEASPEGYNSFVGERGIRLSGGQRQRLGIARALYKQAQVLILDEATSALDNDTEQAVMDAINQLDRNLTVVMIAHRLSTVAKCDRVIRLDHGSVVADGPPSEVLPQA